MNGENYIRDSLTPLGNDVVNPSDNDFKENSKKKVTIAVGRTPLPIPNREVKPTQRRWYCTTMRESR